MKTNNEDMAFALHDVIQQEDINAISNLINQNRNVLYTPNEKLLPIEKACKEGKLNASLLLISETCLTKEQHRKLIEAVKKQRLDPKNSSKKKDYDQILYALDRFYRYQHFFKDTENNSEKIKQAIITLFEDYYAPKSVSLIQSDFLKRVFTLHLMRKHTNIAKNLIESLKDIDNTPNKLLSIIQENQPNTNSFTSSFWRRMKWSELMIKELMAAHLVKDEQTKKIVSENKIPEKETSHPEQNIDAALQSTEETNRNKENPSVFPYDNRFLCDLEFSNLSDPKLNYFIEKFCEGLIKNIQHCHRKALAGRAVSFDDINQMIDNGSACLPQNSQSNVQGAGHLLLTSFKIKADIKNKELENLLRHLQIDITEKLNDLQIRETIQNYCLQAAQQLAHRFKEAINKLTFDSINILIKYFSYKIITRLSKNSIADIQYYPEVSYPAFLVQLATHKSNTKSNGRITKKLQLVFEKMSKYSGKNTTIEGLLTRSDLIYPDGHIIKGERSEKYPPQYVSSDFSSPHHTSLQFQRDDLSSMTHPNCTKISCSPDSITFLHQKKPTSPKKNWAPSFVLSLKKTP